MLQHGVPVDDAVHLDRRGPDVRRLADRHQRHESAVRASGDADFLCVDIAGVQQEFRGVHLILQIAAAEVLVIGFLEGHTVARRSAHVGRDADVSTRGQRRRHGVEIVDRLAGRSTVRQYYRRDSNRRASG